MRSGLHWSEFWGWKECRLSSLSIFRAVLGEVLLCSEVQWELEIHSVYIVWAAETARVHKGSCGCSIFGGKRQKMRSMWMWPWWLYFRSVSDKIVISMFALNCKHWGIPKSPCSASVCVSYLRTSRENLPIPGKLLFCLERELFNWSMIDRKTVRDRQQVKTESIAKQNNDSHIESESWDSNFSTLPRLAEKKVYTRNPSTTPPHLAFVSLIPTRPHSKLWSSYSPSNS